MSQVMIPQATVIQDLPQFSSHYRVANSCKNYFRTVFTFLPVMAIRKIPQNCFVQGVIGKFKCLFDIHEFIGTFTYVVTYHKHKKKIFHNLVIIQVMTDMTLYQISLKS